MNIAELKKKLQKVADSKYLNTKEDIRTGIAIALLVIEGMEEIGEAQKEKKTARKGKK